jgi:hypothetical protein
MAIKINTMDGSKIIVKERSEPDTGLLFVDKGGNQIFSDNISSAQMTIYNKADKAVIGGSDRDVSSYFHNEGEVNYTHPRTGKTIALSATIPLTQDDTAIQEENSKERYEIHILHFKIVQISPAKTFTDDVWVYVENLIA